MNEGVEQTSQKRIAYREYIYEVGDRAKGLCNFLNIAFSFDETACHTTLEQTIDCFALDLDCP